MEQINEQQLQALVERLSLSNFGKPFTHQVKFNSRLRTTGGRVVFPKFRRKIIEDRIIMEINPKLLGDDLTGVIKHELAHYHLYFQIGLHAENNPSFQALLKQIDAPKHSPLQRKPKSFYVYECEGPAKHIYNRNRRINVRKFRCGFDGSRLHLVSEKHV